MSEGRHALWRSDSDTSCVSVRILTSTPLRPLAERLADLSRRSEEIASAFITAGALADLLDQARAEARLRVLTGTFGHTTRRSTFKQLLDATRTSRNQVRVWNSGAHRNLHAKLYLWRLPRGRGVGWVGSANLTGAALGTRRLAPNAFAALVRELYRSSRVRGRTTGQTPLRRALPEAGLLEGADPRPIDIRGSGRTRGQQA